MDRESWQAGYDQGVEDMSGVPGAIVVWGILCILSFLGGAAFTFWVLV